MEKAPKWLQWVGRALVSALVKIAHKDGDGKVHPSEVLHLVMELLEPHMERHPDVDYP